MREWRKSPNFKPVTKPDGKEKKKSYTKKQLAALVNKKVKYQIDKSSEETKTQDDTKAYIMSLIKETLEHNGATSMPKSQASAVSVPTLNSILKRAKNPQS